ncbi:universal stress protein [Pseudomonas saliphila]|uniref:universal stress protein n=1 Tax=Pseudomonas saliphila TaxID=2586906 RepID=UPI00123BA704|nr:universal stress protein [Pseudomonas saliphila]
MTEPNVLACIDGSLSSEAVCDYAAWASLQLGAPLTLLHVLDRTAYPGVSDLSGNIGLGSREHLLNELAALDEKRGKLMREQGRLMLEAVIERARAAGVVDPQSRQRHGELVETVLELETETRLLVIGRQGEEGDTLGQQVGSHLESIIRTMHRPILVAAGDYRKPQSVMLAFDNSATTRKGVEMLADSPLFSGMSIHLVMVGADTNDSREPLNAAQQRLERAGFSVVSAIRAGEVESVLLGYQRDNNIDMIVMGAYGHSRIRQFFVGSTTTHILQKTNRPLLLLR